MGEEQGRVLCVHLYELRIVSGQGFGDLGHVQVSPEMVAEGTLGPRIPQ